MLASVSSVQANPLVKKHRKASVFAIDNSWYSQQEAGVSEDVLDPTRDPTPVTVSVANHTEDSEDITGRLASQKRPLPRDHACEQSQQKRRYGTTRVSSTRSNPRILPLPQKPIPQSLRQQQAMHTMHRKARQIRSGIGSVLDLGGPTRDNSGISTSESVRFLLEEEVRDMFRKETRFIPCRPPT